MYRLALISALCLLAAPPLTAQTDADFALFRPGYQYAYSNPFYAGRPGESEILEMHWEVEMAFGPFVGTDEYHRELSVLVPESDGGYSLKTHFAGNVFTEADDQGWTLRNDEDELRIDYSATIGSTWQAAPDIEGRVDSVVRESFFDLEDDVKYISFTETSSDKTYRSLRISKRYGMLSGPYLSDLRGTDESLSIVGISEPYGWMLDEVYHGLPLVSAQAISNSVRGDKVFLRKTTPGTLNGNDELHIEEVIYETHQGNCDPVLGGVGHNVSYTTLNYFYDANTGFTMDSVIRFGNDFIFVSFFDDNSFSDWRNAMVGTVFLGPDRLNPRVVLRAEDNCMGTGKSLSPLLSQNTSTNYRFQSDRSLPPQFEHSVWTSMETDLNEYASHEIIGQSNQFGNCGEQLDFVYGPGVSVREFPDDERIRVFPNPAGDAVQVSIPQEFEEARVTIYDGLGRLVLQSETLGERRLNLSELAAGVYTVVVRNAEQPLARRRLVKR